MCLQLTEVDTEPTMQLSAEIQGSRHDKPANQNLSQWNTGANNWKKEFLKSLKKYVNVSQRATRST